jgi:hypothetical protein
LAPSPAAEGWGEENLKNRNLKRDAYNTEHCHPLEPIMTTTPEQILDDLSTIIADLGAILENIGDATDRSVINNQIRDLSQWWRAIDDKRAAPSSSELETVKAALEKITQELQSEKQKLTQVAVVIHRGAQAVAIAEKVAQRVV